MIKYFMFIVIYLFKVTFLLSQVSREQRVPVYAFQDSLKETEIFKNQLSIVFDCFPKERAILYFRKTSRMPSLMFETNIFPEISPVDRIDGILFFNHRSVYVMIDSNLTFEERYIKKLRDTFINLPERDNDLVLFYDDNEKITFDYKEPYFEWINIILNDTLKAAILNFWFFTRYQFTQSGSGFVIRKTDKLKPQKIKLRHNIKYLKFIYFTYNVQNGTTDDLYVFYPFEKSVELDYVITRIEKKFRQINRLKDGTYYAKAEINGNKMIVDYTYISDCK